MAIAVFGVVMLQIFGREFERRLAEIDIPPAARAWLYQERIKLAGLEVPEDLDSISRDAIEQVVKESFVSGFRIVMLIASAMALAEALVTWLMIEKVSDHNAYASPSGEGRHERALTTHLNIDWEWALPEPEAHNSRICFGNSLRRQFHVLPTMWL